MQEPTPPEKTIHPPVFFSSAFLLCALLLFAVGFPADAISVFSGLKRWILDNFSWFYVLSVVLLFLFALWLAVGRFGDKRLGGEDARPAYSRFSWYAMLFAAGMGIGLVFYGVAEPMAHFMSPPTGEPKGIAALEHALPLTYHHWGLHAWAIYAIIGLSIAYFTYNRGLPLALRSCFQPVLKERIYGWMGDVIDVLAVFGTLFGLATSLGAGASSVSTGFSRIFGTPDTTQAQIWIIVCITLAATVSLITGVDKGIRRLSEANLIAAGLLLVFVFLVGPTSHVLEVFVDSMGTYLSNFVDRSFRMGFSSAQEKTWIQEWSVVYWGWWIAWAPFVGMFLARISRGRTIRDFVLSVMLVPVVITFIWFSVFGGTALSAELRPEMVAQIEGAGAQGSSVAVYAMLEQLPFPTVLCLLAAIIVTIFFVSSSDSASFVVDMLTSGGHPEPAMWQRVFWASAEGATAAVLLYTGGAEILASLKAGVVGFGLPFCALMLLMAYCLWLELSKE